MFIFLERTKKLTQNKTICLDVLDKSTVACYQDGVRVINTSHVEVDTDAGSVRFSPVKKSDEHTRYNCTATNDVGSDSELGQLRVLGPSTSCH